MGAIERHERPLSWFENTPARAAGATQPLTLSERFWPAFLFVMCSVSSIVQREPAPYDFLLLGGMMLFLLTGQRVPDRLAWPALAVLMVLGGYCAGTMFAEYQEPAFLYIRTSGYLSVSLLFFAALVWAQPERATPAIGNGLVIASVIAASLGIAGYFGVIPNADAFAVYGRATGPFKDPNVFGPSLIFPTLYLVHRLATHSMRQMLWTLPMLMLLLLALFLSFSRGAWMDFTVASLIFLTLSLATAPAAERARLTGLTFVIAVALALAVAWVLTKPEVRSLFLQRFALAQDYDSGEGGRFDNMFEAFKMALANPWGIGPEQWPRISGSGLMPHNIYVNVFVSGGLVSLLGFGGLTVMTIWAGIRALRLTPPMPGVLIAAIGAFSGHALEGLLIDSNHWRHIYVMAGIVWGLAISAEMQARRKVPAPYA
jgi:O-antigen ligase